MTEVIHPAVKAGGMRITQADHPHTTKAVSDSVPVQSSVTTALEPNLLSSSPDKKSSARLGRSPPMNHAQPTRQMNHAPKSMPIQQPR